MLATRSHRLAARAADPDDRRLRAASAVSMVAVAATGVVSLYQLGLLRHLPDPPIRGFDADRVHKSAQAYMVLGLPDGPLAVASFSVTVALAAAAAAAAARRDRDSGRGASWVRIALGVKAAADAAAAAKLTCDEAFKIRAWSAFSVLAAAATFAVLPLTLPAAFRSARTLWRRR